MTRPLFATPEDAEIAFYEALENADLDAMMSVWADDEEIVCVHPGGSRITGWEQVRDAWRDIFAGGPTMRCRLSGRHILRMPRLAIHCVHENIVVTDQPRPVNPIIATNIYVQTERGWRMLVHHASPALRDVAPPEAVGPTVLH